MVACLQVLIWQSCRSTFFYLVASVNVEGGAARRAPFEVPAFLDCEGPPFESVWSSFRHLAIKNAMAGYPIDKDLRETASSIILKYEPVMLAGARAWVVHLRSAASGDIYYYDPGDENYMASSAEAASQSITSSDQQWQGGAAQGVNVSAAMSFCLYGFVTALFIEYRHTSAEDALHADGSRLRPSCSSRLGFLQVAEQLLGGDSHETDFLESSSWPITSLDLHLTLFTPDDKRDLSTGCHVIYHDRMLPALNLDAWPAPLVVDVVDASTRAGMENLRMAAFGLHVSSTLEPVSALMSVVETRVPVSVKYFGHPCYGNRGDKSLRHACKFKCQMLGSPCEDDHVAEILKGMFNSSGYYEELPWSLHDALQALAKVQREHLALKHADLLVCSGPLVLCYLLDALMPDTPLVYPMCSQLLWGAPPSDSTNMMLLAYVRQAARHPHRAFFVCNAFTSAQCLYQTGVMLPIVPRIALYLPAGLRWSGDDLGDRWREVLVLRSRFWHRLPGQYFMDVLESFLRVNEVRYNMTFTMAASFGPEELPPSEIVRYRAVMLVPNDLTVFSFVEVYSMCLPTLVPNLEWLYRLRRTVPFGFLQPAPALPDLDNGVARDGFPFPPWWRSQGREHPEDLFACLHWQRLSELHLLPGVLHFGSVPELLEKLVSADLHTVSAAMAHQVAKQRTDALKSWHATIERLVGSLPLDPTTKAQKTNEFQLVADAQHSQKNDWTPLNASSLNSLQSVLNCQASGFDESWSHFQKALQHNIQKGIPIDWALRARAVELWQIAQNSGDGAIAMASAFFHRFLMGEVDAATIISIGYCHYGLVSVLYVMARHCLAEASLEHLNVQDDFCNVDLMKSAMALLGGSAALDFVEDSEWPISAVDIAALDAAISVPPDGHGFRLSRFTKSSAAHLVRKSVIWRPLAKPFGTTALAIQEGSWRLAIVGVHPSLSVDIAQAVKQSLGNNTEEHFFGLSCPKHHSASHHCGFRCEVVGQCEDDAIFSQILGQMLDWDTFVERPYVPDKLAAQFQAIVEADLKLRDPELIVCTGPFVLCAMLRAFMEAPMLVYLGLTLTYLAAAASLQELLWSARQIGQWSRLHNVDDIGITPDSWENKLGAAPAAFVVTDLIRAAQLHHAIGVWAAAVPPLALYYDKLGRSESDPHTVGTVPHRSGRRALAFRAELWHRAAFGPGFGGLLNMLAPELVEFQETYVQYGKLVNYDAIVLVPWDNDVMTFYELYHIGLPMLLPSQLLMTKWLPTVRWGSMEPEPLSVQSLVGERLASRGPWANQSDLTQVLKDDGYAWVGASDYYQFPHLMYFPSVAGLVGMLQHADLQDIHAGMLETAAQLRRESLGFYRILVSNLLAASKWEILEGGGTCWSGFLEQEDFGPTGSDSCRQLCERISSCTVAAFNGLCCMVYDATCDTNNLRRDGDRAGYAAWRRLQRHRAGSS